MKIEIYEDTHYFKFYVPNAILSTRRGMRALCHQMRLDESRITEEFLQKNRAQLRRILTQHKGWELLNVEDEDGSHVIITL